MTGMLLQCRHCSMQESVKTRHPQLLYESKLYKILQGGGAWKPPEISKAALHRQRQPCMVDSCMARMAAWVRMLRTPDESGQRHLLAWVGLTLRGRCADACLQLESQMCGGMVWKATTT